MPKDPDNFYSTQDISLLKAMKILLPPVYVCNGCKKTLSRQKGTAIYECSRCGWSAEEHRG